MIYGNRNFQRISKKGMRINEEAFFKKLSDEEKIGYIEEVFLK